jgi:Skp family chaperone for outer membrane proteins
MLGLIFPQIFVVSLANALVRDKGLEAKLTASAKALKDAQTRLAAAEAKCKKDVAAPEAKAAKAEKALAEANQKQSKREQAVAERIESLSTSFGSKCDLPV